MTKSSNFVIRGRRAAVAVADERDLAIVRRQFDRLGVEVLSFDIAAGASCLPDSDILFIDDDYLTVPGFVAASRSRDIPVVVLIGTETPSRLKLVIDCEPAAFLMKPLRSAGLYAALVVAFDRTESVRETQARIEKLEERVRSRRILLAAVLQVMASHDLDEPAAFALIRRCAMEQRKSIEQLGAEIVTSGQFQLHAKRTA